jgi:DNA-binding LytR/AlgR family response regulator
MRKYHCIICDDEPVARSIIKSYVEQTPFLEVAAECENALELIGVLQQTEADFLFLDINMPLLDGLSFLRTISKRPQTILTTAYSEHAIEAFDLDVTDYLVKPIPFDRFMRAINRGIEQLTEPQPLAALVTPEQAAEVMVVRFGKTQQKVLFSDILYLEAQANTVKIVTAQQEYKVYQTLSFIEQTLPEQMFVRTHRSFIVNKLHVKTIDGFHIVFLNQDRVPIAEPMREALLPVLGF